VDYALTASCYRADADGSACSVRDAGRLRAKGFAEARGADVTLSMRKHYRPRAVLRRT
jgi:7-cyano-7-deazaguanine synthase